MRRLTKGFGEDGLMRDKVTSQPDDPALAEIAQVVRVLGAPGA